MKPNGESPELTIPVDNITPDYKFDRNFKIIIPSREDCNQNILTPPDDAHMFFTDGSHMNDRSGAGKFATISQAETVAILSSSGVK